MNTHLDVVFPSGRERHGVQASRRVVDERNPDGIGEHLTMGAVTLRLKPQHPRETTTATEAGAGQG